MPADIRKRTVERWQRAADCGAGTGTRHRSLAEALHKAGGRISVVPTTRKRKR